MDSSQAINAVTFAAMQRDMMMVEVQMQEAELRRQPRYHSIDPKKPMPLLFARVLVASGAIERVTQ
jgi:hypothetical protein